MTDCIFWQQKFLLIISTTNTWHVFYDYISIMYNPIGWLRMIASDQENNCLLSIAYPYAPLLVPSGREVNFRARFH